MGVNISRLPGNIRIGGLPDWRLMSNPQYFLVMEAPHLRTLVDPNSRVRHCYQSELVDGRHVHRLKLKTTRTFEIIATYLAKFLPPSILDLEIFPSGYGSDGFYLVDVKLELAGQPSSGTLAWLSFLRVGWEFQMISNQDVPVTCVPQYIADILNETQAIGHHPLPEPYCYCSRRVPATIAQVVRVLTAIRGGVYEKKWVPGEECIHRIGRTVLK